MLRDRRLAPLAAFCFLAYASPALSATVATATDSPDLFQWLESTSSVRMRDWVLQQNERTLKILVKDPRYSKIESEMRAILSARDRLPYPHLRGGWVYNFWQDSQHPRGVWRRQPPEAYARQSQDWDVLLDIDRLDRDEKQDWAWQGEACLPPAYDRCLLQLSHGGSDEVAIREFDVKKTTFMPEGFNLPVAVSNVSWVDLDHVLVDTYFGADSVLRSGYSRIVKLWTRGQPLREARTVLEGEDADLWDTSMAAATPEETYSLLVEFLSRSKAKYYLLLKDYHLARIPLPEDANVQSVFKGRLLAVLRSSWKAGGRTLPAGALIAFPLDKIDDPHPVEAVQLVYAPDSRSSIGDVDVAKDESYVDVLHDVRGRLFRLAISSSGWDMRAVPLPDTGTLKVLSADPFDNLAYVSYESFLTPPAVYAIDGADPGRAPEPVASLPRRFNATNFVVEQNEAVSADGTRVPYFLVRPRSMKFDGSQPVLLSGYGGFESSLTPAYLDTVGKAWLEAGGAYALANIRGGGEFGPAWYQAAVGERRQKSFDDFLAVAEDLIRRKITSPRRLGVMGSSQGGLLAGVAMTERPDLFHAAVCQVPLLDMLRYPSLGAGAAWTAEYGDPRDPKMAGVLRTYSPYQNVKPGIRYPAALLVASTEDDRVSPAHARKMAALLQSLGGEALYFEDAEGGHDGPNMGLESRIRRRALTFVFLLRQLMD